MSTSYEQLSTVNFVEEPQTSIELTEAVVISAPPNIPNSSDASSPSTSKDTGLQLCGAILCAVCVCGVFLLPMALGFFIPHEYALQKWNDYPARLLGIHYIPICEYGPCYSESPVPLPGMAVCGTTLGDYGTLCLTSPAFCEEHAEACINNSTVCVATCSWNATFVFEVDTGSPPNKILAFTEPCPEKRCGFGYSESTRFDNTVYHSTHDPFQITMHTPDMYNTVWNVQGFGALFGLLVVFGALSWCGVVAGLMKWCGCDKPSE